jgi:hypothetical protein
LQILTKKTIFLYRRGMAGCADVCCLDCIIDKIRLLCIAAGLTIGFSF